ncbi:MAG: hypothetical protein Q7S73_00630 [bacterium]|nr:hypothetical protein [bacterium]
MTRMKVFLALGVALLAISDVKAGGGVLETLEISSISEIYSADADRLRDPFVAPNPNRVRVVVSTKTPNLEDLELRGLLISKNEKLAVVSDRLTGISYLLKAGHLLNYSKNPVKGIIGSITGNVVSLTLTSGNKETQELRLEKAVSNRDPFVPLPARR